jgi:hypothetical protein
MSQMIVITGLVPVISLREARQCHMSRDGRDFGREDGASRLLPGHKGGEADFACSSCAGLTRASMMRRKSKILATVIACAASWIAGSSPAMTAGRLVMLRCFMDGRVKPGHDGGNDHAPWARHSGTARRRRTRNPDASTMLVSGFPVRVLAHAPQNDHSNCFTYPAGG